jgi:lipoyl synthase
MDLSLRRGFSRQAGLTGPALSANARSVHNSESEKPLSDVVAAAAPSRFEPKPGWLRVRAPGGESYTHLKEMFRKLDLHTVCEEARCPNVGECWSEGTATIMLLGDTCTRGCRFCAVTTGDPKGAVDVREPEHVARALSQLELQYVVMTMVDRDDLLDGGASHVARTVTRLRELRPDMLTETLLGDFGGKLDYVDITIDSAPNVWAHNIEVVERLQRNIRDVRCSYGQSLKVLARVKTRDASRLSKSSIMVGIGETDEEVLQTMRDLRSAGVDIVTLGQYLRPTPKHAPVDRYVAPDVFASFEKEAEAMGFLYCASGPLVRSSYKAAEVFVRSMIAPGSDGAEVREKVSERLAQAKERARSVSAEAARAASDLIPAAALRRKQ